MNFPVYIDLGFFTIHPHLLFESLAYFIGFRVYLYFRNPERIPVEQVVWILAGAILGAAFGSKLLYWFEDPYETWQNITNMQYLMQGKTLVGGLLGGLIGVEWMKKRIGWTRSTGDDFALPLVVGMVLGRIGCFLTGLDDHTHGIATTWITGVDFGDGVYRHPAQLYEIGFLSLLATFLILVKRGTIKRPGGFPEGAVFQMFMFGYLAYRFGIEFIKPTPHPYFGLHAIQLASLAGMIYYYRLLRGWSRQADLERTNVHA